MASSARRVRIQSTSRPAMGRFTLPIHHETGPGDLASHASMASHSERSPLVAKVDVGCGKPPAGAPSNRPSLIRLLPMSTARMGNMRD